jgi:hypothetical protein
MALGYTWIDCADDYLVVRLIGITDAIKMCRIWNAASELSYRIG